MPVRPILGKREPAEVFERPVLALRPELPRASPGAARPPRPWPALAALPPVRGRPSYGAFPVEMAAIGLGT